MKNVLAGQWDGRKNYLEALIWGMAAVAVTILLTGGGVYWKVAMLRHSSGASEAILQEAEMQPSKKQLSIESLETRLNMSSMGFRLPAMGDYQPERSTRTEHSGVRVISLTMTAAAKAAVAKTVPLVSKTVKHAPASRSAPVKIKSPPVKVTKKTPPVKTTPVVPVVTAPTTKTTTTTTNPSTPVAPPAVAPTVAGPTASVTTSAPVAAVTTPPAPAVPNALTPILAQLYGDDVHDDSATIQQLIDTANADGITNITLPAGTFKLNRSLHFYGSGITLQGQGASTVLDVANNYNGANAIPYGDGAALKIYATLDAQPMMIDQAVTGNTIVFRGQANVTAGQSIFLENGVGSTALIERASTAAIRDPERFVSTGLTST